MTAVSRRTLLVGGAAIAAAGAVGTAGVLVNDGVLPGRVRAYEILGLDGSSAPIPDVTPGVRHDGSFVSKARGGITTSWSLSVPPGHQPAGLPLLVCLHGAGADHRTAFDRIGIDRFLAQAVGNGAAPFVAASVDGGATSYWHPRRDGTDAAAMVTAELVPLLRERFALGTGLGLYGWSMGGYGALGMAVRGAQVDVVAACSPALFASYSATAPGSFDDAADFAANGLRGHGADFPDLPVRIDIGKGDPFFFPVRDFVADMSPKPAGGFEAGAHTDGYMRRVLPAQLDFVAAHLG